jgi:hypothetical protein
MSKKRLIEKEIKKLENNKNIKLFTSDSSRLY